MEKRAGEADGGCGGTWTVIRSYLLVSKSIRGERGVVEAEEAEGGGIGLMKVAGLLSLTSAALASYSVPHTALLCSPARTSREEGISASLFPFSCPLLPIATARRTERSASIATLLERVVTKEEREREKGYRGVRNRETRKKGKGGDCLLLSTNV
jgi:hypothetical protein